MSEQSTAFEKWFESRLAHCEYDKDYVKVMNDKKVWLLTGFEAATAEANKRIAELQSEVAAFEAISFVQMKQIEELQSELRALKQEVK